MKVLVTGASGFVGTFLIEKLIKHNYEVVGLSRTKPESRKIEYFSCDITDEAKVEKVLKWVQPDEVYHLAATAFIPTSFADPMEAYRPIVNGTLVLYESLRKLGIDAKVLFVGSGEVYGDGNGTPSKEEDLLHPNNPYAGAKACADLISEQYAKTYNMKIIRARPFNHTGPGQSANYVCSNFSKQIVDMERSLRNVIQVGNLEVERDFLDVRDVAEAYFLLMKYGKCGEVYNVSSNSKVSIRELLNLLLANSTIKNPEIEIDGNKVRSRDPSVRMGDNTKLFDQIGWRPAFNLNDTLRDLLNYWRHAKLRQ